MTARTESYGTGAPSPTTPLLVALDDDTACWCDTKVHRWGCFTHGPQPLGVHRPRICDNCHRRTYNLIGRCDSCIEVIDPEIFPGRCRTCDGPVSDRSGICRDCDVKACAEIVRARRGAA